jgi:hypothetical protein
MPHGELEPKQNNERNPKRRGVIEQHGVDKGDSLNSEKAKPDRNQTDQRAK